MKKVAIIYCVLFSILSFVGVASPNNDKGKLYELNGRGGLPNFFAKALKGDSIKVAYLGGSITAQKGWRVYSLDWFKQRFPKAVFTEINAAIGGTGSDFGVFRIKEHVLQYKPDLVFVEFAANDGNTPSEKITRSMEGIVRQIWEQNPTTDICFVYTIINKFLDDEQSFKLPNSASTMEKVAENYKIPTINFGFEVASQISNEQLIFKNEFKILNGTKVFSPDGVHPYIETGHLIYQEVLRRSFETMIPQKNGKLIKHVLGKPLTPDYYTNTRMIELDNVALSKNWEIVQVKDNPMFSGFAKYLDQIAKTNQTGEFLEVQFRGQAIGVYDILGPDVGKVIIEIDGVVKDTISRFDKYCNSWRMNYFLIDKLENKNHKVLFRILADPFDKKSILTNKEDFAQNPNKYKENNWYVGKIFIDGQLIKPEN